MDFPTINMTTNYKRVCVQSRLTDSKISQYILNWKVHYIFHVNKRQHNKRCKQFVSWMDSSGSDSTRSIDYGFSRLQLNPKEGQMNI